MRVCLYKLLIQNQFPVLIGGVVQRLHDARGDDRGIDVGGQLFTGLDAADEGVDFLLEMILGGEDGRVGNQGVVLGGVNGEFLAVLQADAALSPMKSMNISSSPMF